jgi:hypothetical protein
MINMKKFFSFVASLLVIGTAFSQKDSIEPAFKLSGSADVYYRYNFNDPKDYPYNNLTSFTNSHNSFELNMASIKVEHNSKKVDMVADLGFGERAEEFSYNDEGSKVAIKQLYVSYSPSSTVKFTLGSWATHIGYEVIDAYLNRNYSMSYMFSYGPFFHTGLKADINLGGTNTLMVGVADPTDMKSADVKTSHNGVMPKMIIGQYATATKDSKVKLYLNFLGGKYNDSAKMNQEDIVLTYAINNKFSLGYNGTLQSRTTKIDGKWESSESWWGSALYVNADPLSWFGLTLRGEYLNDNKSVLGFDSNIFATTLSANFRIDNLTVIPEFRFDNASNNLFTKSSGEPCKSTGSFILGATYHF